MKEKNRANIILYVISFISSLFIFNQYISNNILKLIYKQVELSDYEFLCKYILLYLTMVLLFETLKVITNYISYKCKNKMYYKGLKDALLYNKQLNPYQISSQNNISRFDFIQRNIDSIFYLYKAKMMLVSQFILFIFLIYELVKYHMLFILPFFSFIIIFKILKFKEKNKNEKMEIEMDKHQRKKFYYNDQLIEKKYYNERIAFGITKNIIDRYFVSSLKAFNCRHKITTKYEMFEFLTQSFLFLVSLISAWIIIFNKYINGEILISDVAYLMVFVQILSNNINSICEYFIDIIIAKHKKIEIEEKTKEVNYQKNDVSLTNKCILKFENVAFGYLGNVLVKDANFEIDLRKKYCLLGMNGIGKTTLIYLILGFINPISGKVKLNDIDIQCVSNYMELVSCCFQNKTLFSGTVKDNLMNYDSERLKKYRYLIEKIDILNNEKNILSKEQIEKYNVISEGEMQLLNIVRTLSKKSKFYIFDEPENNLDPKNIQVVRDILRKLEDGILVVTHNLKFALEFENIIWVNNGKVEMFNNKDILLNDDFRKLYEVYLNK